jgi:hypothetical protein
MQVKTVFQGCIIRVFPFLCHTRRLALRLWTIAVPSSYNMIWSVALQGMLGDSKGLSLEQLQLELTSNLYAAQPRQALFHWGATWKRHHRYQARQQVQRELQLENSIDNGPR